MSEQAEPMQVFEQPNFEFGNAPALEVVKFAPVGDGIVAYPGSVIQNEALTLAPGQLEASLSEIVTNYQVIGDPQSTESDPKQFGITIANAHLIKAGVPAILMMSTSGSNLYDKEGKPNNGGNALEIAYTALKFPNLPVVYVEAPGNGSSSDLTAEEYASATKDGRLVEAVIDEDSGALVRYEAFQTMQALARALEAEDIKVGYVAANASGAEFSTGLLAALAPNTAERAMLYNTTGVSDLNAAKFGLGTLWEQVTQRKYAAASNDPLKLTAELQKMAVELMSPIAKRKIDLARASTHNPVKLGNQAQITSKGNRRGQAAAVHMAAAQMQHPDLKQTYVFPQFASQYQRPDDFQETVERGMRLVAASAVRLTSLQAVITPVGQYAHSHYPTMWQSLAKDAFNR